MSRRRFPVSLALLVSGVGGMLGAAQSRINGGLGQQLGSGYVAAVVSFGLGLVVLCVLMLFSRRGRSGIASLAGEVRAGRFPVWGLLGGACGAFFVLTQGMIAPVIGVAMFTVGMVAGQVIGGLIMDRVGLGPGGRVDPTMQRLVGTGLAIVAVIVSVAGSLAGGGAWLVIVPLIAGIGMSWQSAVNGLVRAASQSALTATFMNFIVGTIALVAIAAVSVAVQGWPENWPTNPVNYLGGLIGVVYIAMATVVVRIAGVLLLNMSNVAGQLVASVLLELGLPLAGGVTAGLLVGAAIGLVAVLVAALPSRGRVGERPAPKAESPAR